MGKVLLTLSAAALVLAAGSNAGQDQPARIERESFRQPAKIYRPWVRWWWPGNDVTAEELRREIGKMDEAGIGGAEIQAFLMGLNPKAPAEVQDRVKGFMTPSFYEHVRAALEEAERHGMQLDLTLGSGWPQGGPHISKELSGHTLLWNEKDLEGPRKIRLRVPPPKKPFIYLVAKIGDLIHYHLATYFAEDFKPIAAVAAKPIGNSKHSRKPWNTHDTVQLDFASLANLSDRLTADGFLDWDAPPGRWKIIFFYAGPIGDSPMLIATPEPGLVLDHLKAAAMQTHLAAVLGPGEKLLSPYYGKTLRGYFTDSLEIKAEQLWTDDFLPEFEARRGYDLAPYLPAVPVPMKNNMIGHLGFYLQPEFDFPSGEGERIRYDVDRTVAELFQERFIAELGRYAEAHRLLSRVQAHGMQADLLRNYGAADIPETEQLYAGGNTDFLKLASSAGHLYGRNLVTSESMVWNSRDYMTTPLKIKAAADKLFAAGINGVVYHGFSYTYQQPGFGEQGWAPFSSPFMALGGFSSNLNETDPFWKFLPILNSYIARVQYVLRQGEAVTDAALYYPLFGYPQRTLVHEELTGGLLDDADAPLQYPGLISFTQRPGKLWPEHEWVIQNAEIANLLTANGYNYDHVNEDCLLKATVENGVLHIGQARYRVLIFNRIQRLPLPVVKKLLELSQAGAAIVFVDHLPSGQPGFKDYQQNDAEIQAMLNRISANSRRAIQAGRSDLVTRMSRDLGLAPDVSFDQPQPNLDYIHRRTSGGDYFFLRNAGKNPLSAKVSFPCPDRAPEIWDPWTGEVKPAADYTIENGRVVMDLQFSSHGSLLLGFDRPTVPLRATGLKPVTLSSPISISAWHLETALHDANGKSKPIVMELPQLRDWREIADLKGCSTPGRYTAEINLEEKIFPPGARLMLDLGEVRDAAEVAINGQPAGTLLVPPYACDATALFKPGKNTIEVLVTPTLYNQLLRFGNSGDKRYKQFKGRTNLMPSGLIGPVTIQPVP